MKHRKSTSAALALLAIGVQYLFVFFRPVGAIGLGEVLISEVYPDPSSGKEYVELVNTTDTVVSLVGLELYDVSSPAPGACTNWGKLLSLTGDLAPNEYRAIELASARLNNNGDHVALRKSSGETMDELTYGVCGNINVEKGYTIGRTTPAINAELLKLSPTPSSLNYLLTVIEISIDGELMPCNLLVFTANVSAPTEKLSLVEWYINNELLQSDELSFDHTFENAGTYAVVLKIADVFGNIAQHELEFTIGEPILPDYAAVVLSEVFPSPSDGSSEWIELYNTGEETVNLSGLVIDDIANGGSSPYVLPSGISILAHSYLVVAKVDSKIAFNNGGDDVRMVVPTGQELQKITYPSISTDQSYSFYEGEWLISDQPTPGEQNLPMKEEEIVLPELLNIAVAKERVGEGVRIRAGVTAGTGETGQNIAYVQDGSAGIRVKTNQSLVRGKSYELQGKIGESWGEVYISADSITEQSDSSGFKADKIQPDNPDLNKLSGMVSVTGVVTRVSGGSIWIGETVDSTGTLKVYISSLVSWERPEWIKKGVNICTTGILSQWGFSDSGEPNLRILPRTVTDLVQLDFNGKVLGSGPGMLPETGAQIAVLPGLLCLAVGALGKVYRYCESKRKH